ncbi:MAG: hypothetical protein C4529_06075 [Deltaproteobacteria bacterium]|nr:MAG: hypothetical protein C4529_06075 [Deltaproteobacteria bacterium]
MGKDDWKYDEEQWDEKGEEEAKELPPQIQCAQCLHWVDRESLYCPWCGKQLPEIKRKPSS